MPPRYRILFSVEVDARSDEDAYRTALKLEELLGQPIVRMAIEGQGIKLSGGDGGLTVHEPQRSG